MVTGILEKLKNDFINFFPNLVGALFILILGIILARLLRRFILLLLSKIGLDKLADKINQIDFIASSNYKIVPSQLISSMVYYFVMLITLITAADKLQVQAISNLLMDLINYIPIFISSVILLIIGIYLADFLKKLVYTNAKSLGIPSASFIASFVFYLVMVMFVLSAMSQAKIDTYFVSNSIILFLGGTVLAFAIGYGLASKNTLANFMASFYSNDKIEIGDEISLDGTKGYIISIDKTSVTLRTIPNQTVMIIPLSKIQESKLEIHSKSNNLDGLLD